MRPARVRILTRDARRERHNRVLEVWRLLCEVAATDGMPQRHGCLAQSEAGFSGEERAVVGVGRELDEPLEQVEDFGIVAPHELVGGGINPGLPVLLALEILLVEDGLEGAVVAGVEPDLIGKAAGLLGQLDRLLIQVVEVGERRGGVQPCFFKQRVVAVDKQRLHVERQPVVLPIFQGALCRPGQIGAFDVGGADDRLVGGNEVATRDVFFQQPHRDLENVGRGACPGRDTCRQFCPVVPPGDRLEVDSDTRVGGFKLTFEPFHRCRAPRRVVLPVADLQRALRTGGSDGETTCQSCRAL